MKPAVTLSLYISRQFVLGVLVMLCALTGLVSLFDFIELLRRSVGKDASLGLLAQIAALRMPYIAMEVLPFAVLIGGILCFWRLTRSSELIVARASGVSAFEFLAAPVGCAFLLGAFATMAVSPLSSVMFARAERLEAAALSAGGGPLNLANGQLWVRQADHGITARGVAILHAGQVNVEHGDLIGRAVNLFRLDGDDRLLGRVDADAAVLADGYWTLKDAIGLHPDQVATIIGILRIPTDLTVARVQESFAPPDTLSVWELPSFIGLLKRSGFSSVRHRLHFQALLALPLLAATMALVAAGFSMRPARRGGVARMIGGGVAAGFALFMISKLAEEFGQSGALPVVLAAWAPAAAGLLLAVTLLLHVEDG
ncbi:MAG TPA: LPS export ABC transporter permease LptG [Acetobacteraceae bacterium]|nr:LPS export ABC transporter permease LptG [Acetobacteraceae bacterium]